MTRLYGGNMGRARYSQGYVKLTPTNLWQANWFPYVIDPSTGHEKRVHRTRVVGSAPKMRKYEAERALRAIVEPIQDQNGEQTTFGWFMNNRWLPLREGEWRPSTRRTNLELLAVLEARFGAQTLQSMDMVEMQLWINSIAKTRSSSAVRHLRIFLKAICSEAVDQDYLVKDPARKLTVPKGIRKADTTVLSWEQLKAILACMNQRDQLILMIEATVGLRPSELFALRRRSFSGTTLTITETIYRGKLREYGKTDGSLTTVDLPAPLAQQLTQWLGTEVMPTESTTTNSVLTGAASDQNAFIFPNSRGGFLHKDNYLNRTLYPLRETLGIHKLNFQVLRRTFATLAQKHGEITDVQRQMRHSKPDMTTHYTQAIPESVKSMVEAMYEELCTFSARRGIIQ